MLSNFETNVGIMSNSLLRHSSLPGIARLGRVMAVMCVGCVLTLFFPLVSAADFSANPVLVSGWTEYPVGGGHLGLLEDPAKSLTIEQAASPAWSGRFRSVPEAVPNLGMTDSAVWARFAIDNPTDREARLLLSYDYPCMDYVSLFVPQADSGFQRLDAGDSAPKSPQVIPNHRYVFPITVAAQSRSVYYLRLEGIAAMTFPLTLRTHEAFGLHDHRQQITSGVLIGAFLAFVIYFSILAYRMRNPSCFWFAAYIAMLGLLVIIRKGYLQEWLGDDWLPLNNLINLVDIGLLYFTGAKLLRTFLNVRIYSQRIDLALRVLQWMGLAYIPICMFRSPVTDLYSLLLVGVGPLFSTTVSIIFWFKGVPNAKYFAIGWSVGHVISLLDLLRILGVLPHASWMAYALPTALASSLIFFTLAIIDQTCTYQYLADQDSLTGLANRRHLDQVIDMEWNRNRRHHRPLSLLMVDVDFFKAYNDNYGHKAGDECLKSVAGVLKRFARRSGDLAARYGGEEFVVLLSETDGPEAVDVAEKIKSAVESLGIPHSTSTVRDVVTVSLGVASGVPNHNGDPVSLIKEADQALYQAKRDGRHRVVAS